MRSSVPSQLQSSKESYTVERGGRSLGIARHWQPVLRMYISPFTTSRTFTVRLLPPRLPGRMSGSTWLHSSSVKSLGYRSLLRSYRARFSIVHIGDLSTTQAAPGRLPLHHKRLIRLNMFPNRLFPPSGVFRGVGRADDLRHPLGFRAHRDRGRRGRVQREGEIAGRTGAES